MAPIWASGTRPSSFCFRIMQLSFWVREILKRQVFIRRADEKGREAIAQLKESTGQEAQLLVIDLADLASVKRASKDLERCVYM